MSNPIAFGPPPSILILYELKNLHRRSKSIKGNVTVSLTEQCVCSRHFGGVSRENRLTRSSRCWRAFVNLRGESDVAECSCSEFCHILTDDR